jgi:hypothetical protein
MPMRLLDTTSCRIIPTCTVSTVGGELYSYDDLDQLEGFQLGTLTDTNADGRFDSVANLLGEQSWNYDGLGNWNTVTTDGVAQNRSHNAQNEITVINGQQLLDYDKNGNLTADDQGRTLVYDAWNRLVKVIESPNEIVAAYQYDGLMRRNVEAESGVTRHLYYSPQWQVIEERVSGVAHTQYVWSPIYIDSMIARDRNTDNIMAHSTNVIGPCRMPISM